MAKKKEEDGIHLPVTFGGFSCGDITCRISARISRANYTVNKADTQLVDRRLTVKLIARANGAGPDQPSLPGADNDQEIEGVGDCKGFSANGKRITFGLTFMKKSVDTATLQDFPKKDGLVIITGMSDIPEEEKGDEDEDSDDDK